jgi:hypothetical protein
LRTPNMLSFNFFHHNITFLCNAISGLDMAAKIKSSP